MTRKKLIRCGIGYDIHRLKKGRKLILGGIEIPSKKGLIGHSDADVLLHAICDALLGAAALGDIGMHFPNRNNEYKGISSLVLLSRVRKIIAKAEIINIDATIILEEPKINSFVEMMKKKISQTLDLPIERISIKATTNEGLGPIGRCKGCAAIAIATISF